MKKSVKARNLRYAPALKTLSICVGTYIALFVMIYCGITPEQYDIQVGAPAPLQIYATKDVKDIVTTQALQEAAANEVAPSYKSVNPNVLDEVTADLTTRFDALRALRSTVSAEDLRTADEETLAEINETLSMSLTREQLLALVNASRDNFDGILSDAMSEVQEALISTIPEGQESYALRNIQTALSRKYTSQLTSVIIDAVRGCLRPNMLIDEEITTANRERAREAVKDEIYVKDQVIVRQGEIVTLAQYTMISSLGLLQEDSFDLPLLGGIALLVLLMMTSLAFYLLRFNNSILKMPKMLLLYCVIVLLVVGLSMLFSTANTYLMPISLSMMLIGLLIDTRLGLFTNIMLALFMSLLASERFTTTMFSIVLMSAISGPITAILFSQKMLRATTLLAGLIVAATNYLTTIVVGLINSAEQSIFLHNAMWASGSGILSAIFCVGSQVLLEWLFNLPTASKLIELSNPNQPLLRRLLLEASGTYHHSIIVANLAETAASAIGANGLLARVGAYYHDIGKLKRPAYFKENQMGDNPHDRTDPRVSAAILVAHPRDGAQMALKEHLPSQVIDIIRQHHGDSPATYFYDKAVKLYGDQVDISAFRYDGPRPLTREAAVVMLADSIEAATRSMPNPDPEKIDALIRKIVRGKLNDGQLDSSNLTFNELDKICSAFSTVLTGAFHERIEYPDIAIPQRLDKLEELRKQPEEPSEPEKLNMENVVSSNDVPSSSNQTSSEEISAPVQPITGQPAPPVNRSFVGQSASTNANPSTDVQPRPTMPITGRPAPAAPVNPPIVIQPPVTPQPTDDNSEDAKEVTEDGHRSAMGN